MQFHLRSKVVGGWLVNRLSLSARFSRGNQTIITRWDERTRLRHRSRQKTREKGGGGGGGGGRRMPSCFRLQHKANDSSIDALVELAGVWLHALRSERSLRQLPQRPFLRQGGVLSA